MIEIFVSESSPSVGFVWNVQDVFTLREDHRIVGSLSGCLPRAPRQDNFLGVPLLLSLYEVDLLVSEGLGETLTLPLLRSLPCQETRAAFDKYRETSYQGQVQVYRDLRKREIYRMADKIVEGKRRKFLTDKNNEIEKLLTDKNNESEKEQSQNSTSISESTSGILLTFVGPTWSKKAYQCSSLVDRPDVQYLEGDGQNPELKISELTNVKEDTTELTKSAENSESRDEILEKEFSKIKDIQKHQEILQTFNSHPWVRSEDKIPYDWQPIMTPLEEIRKSVFRKLWLRGFYITSGEKFGGDFLVYPGDPCMFHARYIVVCTVDSQLSKLSARDLVCRSRLGTAVKKTVLMACSTEEGEIEFKTLKRLNEKRKQNEKRKKKVENEQSSSHWDEEL